MNIDITRDRFETALTPEKEIVAAAHFRHRPFFTDRLLDGTLQFIYTFCRAGTWLKVKADAAAT
jgi:hypothetical protein